MMLHQDDHFFLLSFTIPHVSITTRIHRIFDNHHHTPPNTKKKNRNMSGKGKGKGKSSSSSKAGLQLPVARIGRYMRKCQTSNRLGSAAPVYMAAVMEYMCAEILELAGNAAHDNKRTRITPRHITMAIRYDDELNKLMKDKNFANGGVRPHIHPVLAAKKKRKSKRK